MLQDRLGRVQALRIGGSRRVGEDLAGWERRVPCEVTVVMSGSEPADQPRSVRRADGKLIPADQALQHQHAGRIAEVGNDDVDQRRRHLVDVELPAGPGKGTVEQGVAHHRGVEETLLRRRRDAQDHQRQEARVRRADRLNGDHRVGAVAVAGLDRQHRGTLTTGAGGIDESLQPAAVHRLGDHGTEVDAEQGTGRLGEDLPGGTVMLEDPARLVDADDQRPRRRARQERRDVGCYTGCHHPTRSFQCRTRLVRLIMDYGASSHALRKNALLASRQFRPMAA